VVDLSKSVEIPKFNLKKKSKKNVRVQLEKEKVKLITQKSPPNFGCRFIEKSENFEQKIPI